MSENKDLEIIKQLCDVEVPYDENCRIHASALGEIQDAAQRMADEIERVKAERPDIVTCGECKHRGTDTCWLAEFDDSDEEYETFWAPMVGDNDYCSRGVRREAGE